MPAGQGEQNARRISAAIFDLAPIGIEIYDREGRLVEANKKCLELFGVEDVESVRRFHLFDDPSISADTLARLRQGEPVSYEAIFDFDLVRLRALYPTRNRGSIHLGVHIEPIKDAAQASPSNYIALIQDVTRRKEAEESLRQEKELFSLLMDNAPFYVFFKDHDLRALRLSKNFEQMHRRLSIHHVGHPRPGPRPHPAAGDLRQGWRAHSHGRAAGALPARDSAIRTQRIGRVLPLRGRGGPFILQLRQEPARAGHRKHHHQRSPGHAEGWTDRGHCTQRRVWREGSPDAGSRRLRQVVVRRPRHRHAPRGDRKGLRSLLHDQAERPRPRAGDLLLHHPPTRRMHPGRILPGARQHLPRVSAGCARIAACRAGGTRPVAPGRGLFVVMDDEEVVRETIALMLSSFGYDVATTANGREAFEYLQKTAIDGQPVAGMVLDLTVPGDMGGEEAIAPIRKLAPSLPVFVASSYADDPVMATPASYGFTASIGKPFSRTELAEMLHRYIKSP